MYKHILDNSCQWLRVKSDVSYIKMQRVNYKPQYLKCFCLELELMIVFTND